MAATTNNDDCSNELARSTTSGCSGRRQASPRTEPLSAEEFERIFSRVPRLTVELVIVAGDRGVLLALRDFGPCKGLWHLPGGTVRFGEPVIDAVSRVARDELGLSVRAGEMLGYIEYPSHYANGLDCPVGLAFQTEAIGHLPHERDLRPDCAWFAVLPNDMHDEQRSFLVEHVSGLSAQPSDSASARELRARVRAKDGPRHASPGPSGR